MSSSRSRAVEATVAEYDLDAVLDVDGFSSVPRGTNLLIRGPAMVGKAELALDLLAAGSGAGQPSVLVSPSTNADRLLEQFGRQGGDPERAFVVDCSGQSRGSSFEDDARVMRVSAPDDLTGVGMGIVKAGRRIGDDVPGVRMAVLSVSTLLQYADRRRVFNFLHTVQGRAASAGYLGVSTLDTDTHDEQTVNTMTSLYDGVVELREDGDGREARVVGLPGVDRSWTTH